MKTRVLKNTPWSDDLIARLRALWDTGRSTTLIGRELGVSKNAVISKANRLDLPARAKTPVRGATPSKRGGKYA
jgi:GcrA cell cycle regulator